MGKSAPKAPDPVRTAEAQTASNKETAIAQARLNRINQFTPEGSRVFEEIGSVGGVPQFQETVTLSPEGQAAFEAQQRVGAALSGLAEGQLGRIESNVGQEFDISGLPQAPTADDASRQRVEQALFDRATSRLDPRFERQQEDLETQLANQGFTRGTEGFQRELSNLRESQGDQLQQALNQAILAGGAEQSRQFGLQDVARQRGLQEQLTVRNQPLNELAALLRGQGVSQPQFQAVPQTAVAPTDVAGITLGTNQLAQGRTAAQNQFGSDILQTGATLGGAALLASDRRIKEDIVKIAELENGLNVYSFKYVGSPATHIGLMAQEVEEIHPEAVVEIDGVKHVNYALATK